MLNLKGIAIREFMKWRSSHVKDFSTNSCVQQHQLLLELVQSASKTVFGKEYDFSQIKNYQDFKSAIPISEYDDLKKYFERTLHGEQNVFWAENIYWFSKSSGTTSDVSKFIPVSKTTLDTGHYKGAFDVMSQFCLNKPQTNIFNGKTLVVSGSQKRYDKNPRVRVGDVSSILVYNQPSLADFLRTPSKAISLIEDFEEKLSIVAKKSIKENVTGIAGVPTWNIVLLQKILAETGKQHIGEIWPEMELYIHGGVNFEPHRAMFQKLIPLEQMEYLQVYNASEGFFAFQDRLGADDMLLATNHGVFYEFIPIDQINDEKPEIFSIDEVQTGQQYALVISTNSGLWRYKIGDTVLVTSTQPFRIKVTGRTKFFINAFGEELMVDNADKAILKAAVATNSIVRNYTAGPKYFDESGKGAHEWMIEFALAPKELNEFVILLDENLRKVNSDYDAKRSKDLALTLPIVHSAPQGLFYQWLKSKNKIGAQNKVPQLSNNRVILEELLALI